MKKWKELERVVALIEKSLSPYDKVHHDINLPVLASTNGSERQCDVVITSGTFPREIITIVEVQKRSKKIEINDFCGWLMKKNDVGAQRLICVSKIGFPKSVIEKAKIAGPSVLLITLKELELGKWPFPVLSNSIRIKTADIVEITNVQIEVLNPVLSKLELTESTNVKIKNILFKIDDKEKTLYDLLEDFIYNHLDISDMKSNDIKNKTVFFPINNEIIFWKQFNNYKKVKLLKIVVKVVCKDILLPLSAMSYKQIDCKDELAWLFKTIYKDQKGGKHKIKIVIIPKNDCTYNLTYMCDTLGSSIISMGR